jgi:hypothetical protein
MTSRARVKQSATMAEFTIDEIHGALEAGNQLSRVECWWLVARVRQLEKQLQSKEPPT